MIIFSDKSFSKKNNKDIFFNFSVQCVTILQPIFEKILNCDYFSVSV